MKIVVTSGGFDPLHSGHIAYLSSARKLGDKLIVALNSDQWLSDKKGSPFIPFLERKIILEALKVVDEVIAFKDDELGSCKNALSKIILEYPNDEIIFANGGDRNERNIPELELNGVNFVFGVGGSDKRNSSSEILKKFLRNNKN